MSNNDLGAEDDSSSRLRDKAPVRGSGIELAQWVMARSLDIGEWERSMDHGALVPYLREETAEFIDAVSDWESSPSQENEESLKAELADVLLQVLFHAELARRRGSFDFNDVADAFVAKMRSRSPYLFEAGEDIVDKQTQDRLWQEGKQREREAGRT